MPIDRNIKDRLLNTAETLSGVSQRFLDRTVRRPVSGWVRLLEFFIIKYLYIFLAVLVLGNATYHGSGNYHVNFVFWHECVASVCFLVVSLIYLRLRIQDFFVSKLMLFLYVLYYIPINSAYSVNNTTFAFFILSNLYFVLLILVVFFLGKFVENRKDPRGRIRVKPKGRLYENKYVNLICFIVCVLYVIHKIGYNGFEFSLSLVSDEVYTSRAGYQAYLQQISGTLFAYLLVIVRNLAPFLISYYIISALLRRKVIPLITIAICVVSIFSVNGQKSVLFTPILAVAVFICYKLKILKNFDRVFIYGMICLLLVCLGEHFILNSNSIYMLLIRREMYYPAWLNTLYYDFFSQNDKIMWTQNVFLLQNIFDPVYDLSPLELISNAYYGGVIPSPNTGMFAEAYMHFGVAGTFIYPVLLGTMITFFGRVYRDYGPVVQVALATKLVLSLTNVPITRTSSVFSFVLFAVVLWIVPRLNIDAKIALLKNKTSVVKKSRR